MNLSLTESLSDFYFWHYRVTLGTCDLWDIWSDRFFFNIVRFLNDHHHHHYHRVSCIMYHHVTFPHVHDQIIESLRTKFSLRISNQNLGEERGWKVWGGWFGCFFAILFTKCLPNVSLFLQAFRWDQTVIPQLTSINMALKCPEQIVNNSIWGNWATDHFFKQVVNWKMPNHNTTPSCFPTRASFFLSH